MTRTSASTAALADHPFLSAIPSEALRRLAVHVQCETFAAEQVIFREGDTADRFILIRRGLVRLDIEVPDVGAFEIETLGADAALGWSWLFAPYAWQLSATAVERTTALVFDADVLRSVMAADSVLGYELMRRFANVIFERLKSTRLRLTDPAIVLPVGGGTGVLAARRTNAERWK